MAEHRGGPPSLDRLVPCGIGVMGLFEVLHTAKHWVSVNEIATEAAYNVGDDMGFGKKVRTDMFAITAYSQLAATRGAAKRAVDNFKTPGPVG
jgi:hypothetical protein